MNETQEKIQAVTELRFAVSSIEQALVRTRAEYPQMVPSLRSTFESCVDGLQHIGTAIEELKLGLEQAPTPSRVRIDVQDLDGRQAVLVSGGRLLAHSVDQHRSTRAHEGRKNEWRRKRKN